MRRLFALALACMAVLGASAQKGETVTISGGETLASKVYELSEFTKGTIIFKDGQRATPLMNYNMLSKTIQYKDAKGATMDIGNPDDIATLSFNGKSYVYTNPDFCENVTAFDGVVLARQRYLLLRDVLGVSGYGGNLSTTSSASHTGMEQNLDYTLPDGESRVYEVVSDLFIVKAGRKTAMNQKNLLKAFPKYKNALTEYISSHQVDLSDSDAVISMLGEIIN